MLGLVERAALGGGIRRVNARGRMLTFLKVLGAIVALSACWTLFAVAVFDLLARREAMRGARGGAVHESPPGDEPRAKEAALREA